MAAVVRKHRRRVVIPLIGVLGVVYFGYHAVFGAHGLIARDAIAEREQAASEELERITLERDALRDKITLLSSRHVDRDFLDEQARVLLGYVASDEVIVTGFGAFSDKAAPPAETP